MRSIISCTTLAVWLAIINQALSDTFFEDPFLQTFLHPKEAVNLTTASQGDALGVCDTSILDLEKIGAKAIANLVKDHRHEYDILPGLLNPVPRQIGNPSGAYLTAIFPPIAHPFGFCTFPDFYSQLTCATGYHLGERDAIVIPFCTPPKVDYFGINSYVTVRFKENDGTRGSPRFVAAELGDSANQLTLNTTGGKSNNNFGKRCVYISTADQETALEIKEAYVKAGFPAEGIHIHIIPSNKVHFTSWGYESNFRSEAADGFGTLLRMTNLDEGLTGQFYRLHRWPIYVLRKRNEDHPVPMTPAPRKERKAKFNEYDRYQKTMETLSQIILKNLTKEMSAWEQEAMGNMRQFKMEHMVPDADRCLADPNYKPEVPAIPSLNFPGIATCGWLTTDGLYTFMAKDTDFSKLKMDSKNNIFIVVGVDHVKLGRATSSSMMLTSLLAMESHFKTFDFTHRETRKSASHFAPSLPESEDLFVHAFARRCPKLFSSWCTEVPYYRILPNEPLYFVERKYLNPKTTVGPAAEEVVPPMIFSLKI